MLKLVGQTKTMFTRTTPSRCHKHTDKHKTNKLTDNVQVTHKQTDNVQTPDRPTKSSMRSPPIPPRTLYISPVKPESSTRRTSPQRRRNQSPRGRASPSIPPTIYENSVDSTQYPSSVQTTTRKSAVRPPPRPSNSLLRPCPCPPPPRVPPTPPPLPNRTRPSPELNLPNRVNCLPRGGSLLLKTGHNQNKTSVEPSSSSVSSTEFPQTTASMQDNTFLPAGTSEEISSVPSDQTYSPRTVFAEKNSIPDPPAENNESDIHHSNYVKLADIVQPTKEHESLDMETTRPDPPKDPKPPRPSKPKPKISPKPVFKNGKYHSRSEVSTPPHPISASPDTDISAASNPPSSSVSTAAQTESLCSLDALLVDVAKSDPQPVIGIDYYKGKNKTRTVKPKRDDKPVQAKDQGNIMQDFDDIFGEIDSFMNDLDSIQEVKQPNEALIPAADVVGSHSFRPSPPPPPKDRSPTDKSSADVISSSPDIPATPNLLSSLVLQTDMIQPPPPPPPPLTNISLPTLFTPPPPVDVPESDMTKCVASKFPLSPSQN